MAGTLYLSTVRQPSSTLATDESMLLCLLTKMTAFMDSAAAAFFSLCGSLSDIVARSADYTKIDRVERKTL